MESIIEKINRVNSEQFAGVKSISVSKLISYCHKEFDKEGVAKKTWDKHFNDESSKYFQKSPEEIVEMWEQKADESRMHGLLLDDYAEACLEHRDDMKIRELWKLEHNIGGGDEKLDSVVHGLDQFLRDISKSGIIEYIGRELPMYIKHGDATVNGRLDCLFVHKPTGIPIVVDWKTNEKIEESNKFNKMLGPCYMLDDCNLNHYSMQVGIYRMALAQTYDLGKFEGINAYIVQVGCEGMNGRKYKIWKPSEKANIDVIKKAVDFALQKDQLVKN